MRSRWRLGLVDLLLLVLAVVVAATVVATLRDPGSANVTALYLTPSPSSSPSPVTNTAPSPTSAPTEPTLGVAAASGSVVLRWTGAPCPSGEPGPLLRSADGGASWRPVGTPFATVEQLLLTGRAGLVRGLDTSCDPIAATTRDAGVTWRPVALPDGTTSLDVLADGSRWAVVAGELRRGDAAVTDPCRLNDAGAVSLVSATSADAAWVLCQDADGSGRLLLRTADAGRTWRRLAGRRTETGLAGSGVVAAMDHLPGDAGWALIRGSACPEGELRVTSAGGAGWTALPCIARAVPGVTRVLSVTFADARNGTLVVLRGGDVRLLRTGDGGRSWTELPA